MSEQRWYALIANRLSAATGKRIVPSNIEDWMEGGPTYNSTEAVIKEYLGADLYEAGENLARLDSVLDAVLEGKDTVTVGGITFKDLQNR